MLNSTMSIPKGPSSRPSDLDMQILHSWMEELLGVGWNSGLAAMAADQKSDERTYYNAHAWVKGRQRRLLHT